MKNKYPRTYHFLHTGVVSFIEAALVAAAVMSVAAAAAAMLP